MSAHALKLYTDRDFHSPYAMSVFVGLTEKKLPFTVATVDLGAGQEKLAPYRDLALTARVPALEHDGFVLSESSAICEYLEEAFPAPGHYSVLPRGLHERARARQIQAWLRSDLMPIRVERSTATIFYDADAAPLSAEGRAAADKLIAAADALIHSPNLFGDWCIADTDLAVMLKRLIHNGDAVPQKLQDYVSAQWQRPSLQQWMAHLPKP